VEHVRTRQYGTVVLANSPTHFALTVLFAVMAALIIAFFFFFGTTRKAQSRGVLVPTSGIIRIFPAQNGILTESRIVEGMSVQEGDILFILSGERSSINNDSTEKVIANLLKNRSDSFETDLIQSNAQVRQRLSALLRRADDLVAEVGRNEEQINLQSNRVILAEQAYKRFNELQITGYVSASQVQDKQAEVLDQRQRIADLHRIKSANERDLRSVKSDANDLKIQAQRDAGALERSVSAIKQDLEENEAHRKILIRAPKAGIITAITGEIGQTITTSSTLAVLLPANSKLEAEVYAPSRAAGFIRPGMTVLLRYQAYPHQKFGQYKAIVREVAITSMRPEELAMPGVALEPGAPSEPLYRIRLQLNEQNIKAYGKKIPLKSGMIVDASIMLEHRYLYEWILEPLFSISGRL
jgi:membrane fusion protein